MVEEDVEMITSTPPRKVAVGYILAILALFLVILGEFGFGGLYITLLIVLFLFVSMFLMIYSRSWKGIKENV